MLRDLHITDLGVIDDAHLEVASGLNVLTGETGAGKTMVVDALALLLGERAAGVVVRSGADAAAVEAHLEITPPARSHDETTPPATSHDGADAAVRALAAAGHEPDGGEVLVARQVNVSGRSRAQLQGRGTTAAALADVVGPLIEIHGQHEFQTLLRAGVQRDLLDRYAGADAAALRRAWARAWRRQGEVAAELETLRSRAAERAREAELLRYQLAEIDAAGVRVGEKEELTEEAERLTHAETLRDAAGAAHALLAGDDDPDAGAAAPAAAQAARLLGGPGGHDPTLGALAERAAGVAADLTDLASDLRAYAESVQADPARLAEVTDRVAAYADLERKYGSTGRRLEDPTADGGRSTGEEAVLAYAAQAAARLADLDGGTVRTGELEAEADRLRAELDATGPKLTAIRTQAAAQLAAAVRAELDELNMAGARLEVAVTPDDPPTESGPDRVELQLAANPGLPLRPLAKAASGGELSRVMLALRVVLAAVDQPATIVFDEVDAGVGGRTAAAVGRRLATLARVHQILVVTHLPQIAAFADRHFVVEKHTDSGTTRTRVHALDTVGRRTELSRMLSGSPESAIAQAHADELLAGADAAKQTAALPPAASSDGHAPDGNAADGHAADAQGTDVPATDAGSPDDPAHDGQAPDTPAADGGSPDGAATDVERPDGVRPPAGGAPTLFEPPPGAETQP